MMNTLSNGMEPLLSCSVKYLHFHCYTLEVYYFHSEVNPRKNIMNIQGIKWKACYALFFICENEIFHKI